MFSKIGKKVKVLAIILFALMLTGYVAGMILLLSLTNNVDTYLFLSLLAIPVAFLICWIASWPLYALGQAADKAESTEEQIGMLRGEIAALRKELAAAGVPGRTDSRKPGNPPRAPEPVMRRDPAPPRRDTPPAHHEIKPARPDPATGEAWTCRHCGTLNVKARISCRRCGMLRDGSMPATAPVKPAAPVKPVPATKPAGKPKEKRAVDPELRNAWICPDCEAVVLWSRGSCPICGVGKPVGLEPRVVKRDAITIPDRKPAPAEPEAPKAEPEAPKAEPEAPKAEPEAPKAEPEAPKAELPKPGPESDAPAAPIRPAPEAPLRPDTAPAAPTVSLRKAPTGMWNCPNCLMDNKAESENCRYCGYLRPRE